MKSCSKCGKEKPLEAFPPIRRGEPKLQSWCRACFADYGREYYRSNRDAQTTRLLRNNAATRKDNRRRMIEYLLAHACVDCGEKDIVVLEADHLRDKERDVGALIASGATWPRIERELAKCEIRCANCHRRMTAKRSARSDRASVTTQSSTGVGVVQQLLLQDGAVRLCRVCKRVQTLTSFPYRSRWQGTRHWICLQCQREASHQWYVRTQSAVAKRHSGYGRRKIQTARRQVDDYLRSYSCVDCGESEVLLLDFDHVRGKKLADVSTLAAAGQPWDVLAAEIEKCDVRCANCHRRRTVERMNGYRMSARRASVESVA